MFNEIPCENLSDLLASPFRFDRGETHFLGKLTVVRVRVWENGDMSFYRLNHSMNVELLWYVKYAEIKGKVVEFNQDTFMTIQACSSNPANASSFIVKFACGQIAFNAGIVYLRAIKDIKALQTELSKLDEIFEI